MAEKNSTNKLYFDNGMSIPVAPGDLHNERHLQWFVKKYEDENGAQLVQSDIDGYPDLADKLVAPLTELGIGGPLMEGGKPSIKNMAGNMLANQLTGGGGGMFQRIQEPKFKASQIRSITDLAGDISGPTAAAAAFNKATAAAPLSPSMRLGGSVLAAGGGGLLANMGMDKLQTAMGVRPKIEDPLHVFAREAIMEGIGRGFFGGLRRFGRWARVGGRVPEPEVVAKRAAEWLDLKIKPRVFQVLDRGGLGDAMTKWMGRNPLTSARYYEMMDEQFETAAKALVKDTEVAIEGVMRTPTATTAGQATEYGMNRFTSNLLSTWETIDDAVWARMPAGKEAVMPVTETMAFLGDAGSNHWLFRHVGSPKIRALANAFNKNLVDPIQVATPQGLQVALHNVKEMPIADVRKFRTAIGKMIADWEPGAKYTVDEMKKLHSKLGNDVTAAINKQGGPDALKIHEANNEYWSSNMRNQETLMKSIVNSLGADPAKAWSSVKNAVKGNQYKTVNELMERLGEGSDEWKHVRNMIVRSNVTPSTPLPGRPMFPDAYVAFRNTMERDMTDLVFGKSGKFREHWDNVYKLAESLKRQEPESFARFTLTEMAGPTAALGAAGGLQGMSSDSPYKGAAIGALFGVGLSVMTGKAAWRLLMSESYVKALQRTINEPLVSIPANIIRIGAIYPSLDLAEKEALMEFFGTITAMTEPGGRGKQQPPVGQQMMNRPGLGLIPPVRAGGR
jgi:hypothetical protein